MTSITAPGEWTYGLALPVQTLTRTLADPWEDAAGVDELVTVARRAEATGHSFVGVCDHVAIPDNDYAKHMGTTWYDTVATLAYLAACTTTVNLASAVWIASYRHPLLTAKSFGTLDRLSGGRAILGVGAGHVEAEFEALGVDFDRRGQLLDETLKAVRGAFAGPYVSHDGDAFSYRDVGVGPAPVRELPIWGRRQRPDRVAPRRPLRRRLRAYGQPGVAVRRDHRHDVGCGRRRGPRGRPLRCGIHAAVVLPAG